MGKLKNFSNFFSLSISEKESQNLENLEQVLSMIKMTKLSNFFEERGLDLINIEPGDIDGESIIILLGSKSYGGEIPKKISYYLDEFEGILEEEIGVKTSWRFSPNYNCRKIIFDFDNPIDPKVMSVKQALRF